MVVIDEAITTHRLKDAESLALNGTFFVCLEPSTNMTNIKNVCHFQNNVLIKTINVLIGNIALEDLLGEKIRAECPLKQVKMDSLEFVPFQFIIFLYSVVII